MNLHVDVAMPLGAISIEARFTSGPGVTALFGPSGAGKTSLLNAIAGLLRPARGRIAIGETVYFDASEGIDVPADRRRIGYVFQEGRLLPHLTVEQNLVYGRFFTPKGERYADFDHVVELLDLRPLLARRPGRLSGGETQRVAIGRALLASPRLLLMDEPLASLDAPRKREILAYVRRLRDELSVPMVYVSHVLEEVTRVADTLVLIAAGKVFEAGPTAGVAPRAAALERDSLRLE